MISGEERLERLRGLRQEKELTWQPRVVAEMSAKALAANYRAIAELVPGQALLPMVKADAYGHGAAWVAAQLHQFPRLYALGVASLEEGAEVRRALGARGRRTPVIVFSGTCPWSDEKGQFCERNGLTPVIASDADWQAFVKGGWPGRLAYEIKFNTGMNRLGLGMGMLDSVAKTLKALAPEQRPQGVFTHVALGEDALAKLSAQQRERFEAVRARIAPLAPGTHFHLANSAAIWNAKQWRLDGLTEVVRPGLALYGVPPWEGAPARGISPVLTLKAAVVKVQVLKRGESVGYGATWAASADSQPVATIAAGYADGLHRAMSNQGHVWLSGRAERVLGRVSMDMTAVSCGATTKVGEWAELIGPNVDPWAQAKAAGTLPYEVLTSVSPRVQRQYG